MKTRTNLIFRLFLFSFAIVFFSTCKKSVDYPNYNNPSDTLQQNVKLIDANNSQLISDSTQLSQGMYKIEFTGTIPVISTGDVIVGAAGDGFLRRVTGITSQGNIYTFQTEQADMSELFNTANFSFQTGISPTKATSSAGGKTMQKIKINYIAHGVKLSADGLTYDFSNTIIYQNGGVTFKITQGNAQFDPNFIGNVEYSLGLPTKISCYTDNASLKLNCNLNLNASESVTIQDYKIVLADFKNSIKIFLGGVPVVIVAHTKLTATLNTSVDAVFNMNTGITKTYGMTLGATYENGAWTGLWNLTSAENFLPVAWTGNAQLGEKLVITPEVDFLFYGIVGPYFRPQMWETFNMGVTVPPPDWDARLDAGLDAKVGVVVKIFGKTLTTCDLPPYTTSVALWKAPDNLEIVSGDNQTGSLGQPLPNPIIVVVKDNLGNPLAGALVHFQIAEGGGSVTKEIVVTNSSGTAQTNWTLGSSPGNQTVNAVIKNSSGAYISTKAFNANTSCNPNGILGTWNLLMYIRDANEPLGYRLEDVYWILVIYANGQMTFQASSETKVQNTTYTFSGCHFSFTLVPSLSPCFDYVDGVNTYIDNLDPSNGYHHVTFIKQ